MKTPANRKTNGFVSTGNRYNTASSLRYIRQGGFIVSNSGGAPEKKYGQKQQKPATALQKMAIFKIHSTTAHGLHAGTIRRPCSLYPPH